jgi:hypothetical protein
MGRAVYAQNWECYTNYIPAQTQPWQAGIRSTPMIISCGWSSLRRLSGLRWRVRLASAMTSPAISRPPASRPAWPGRLLR